MPQIIEKRTFDTRLYDIVCTGLLADGETVASIASVTADQGALVFGIPVANPTSITYDGRLVVAPGKVIQVEISGGLIPPGSDSLNQGIPNLLCTIRARFSTSMSPNQIEATMLLVLRDQLA